MAASVCLLLAIALLCAGLELACRELIMPASRILGGNIAEWQAAVRVRRASAQRHTALFVGNSLLDAGVDFPQLRSAVALADPGWQAQRLMIEGTYYFDWYYGLRRLLAEGARPDVIVLVLSPEQLNSNNYRDSLFAPIMLQAGDLRSLSRAAALHPTVSTGLLLGHYSWSYGFRGEWRKNLLRLAIPDFGDLARLFIPKVAANSQSANADPHLDLRLEDLRKLTADAGIRLVMLLPPLAYARPLEAQTTRAVRHAGIPLLVPVDSGGLSPEMYIDGVHLAPEGRRRFMQQMVPAVTAELRQGPGQPQPTAASRSGN